MSDRPLVGILAAVILAACQPQVVPAPSEAEARRFLDRAVELAQAGDFESLCAIGGGNCEGFLDDAGRDAPDEDPRVIGTRIQEPTPNRHGGMVLEICGRDDAGELYYSEMVVFHDSDDELIAIEPAYWAGIRIADADGGYADVGTDLGEDALSRCE